MPVPSYPKLKTMTYKPELRCWRAPSANNKSIFAYSCGDCPVYILQHLAAFG